jgi:hypothetical protein
VSQAPGGDPEHGVPVVPAVGDSEVPAEPAGVAPAATGQREAGDPTGISAAAGIPDMATGPDGPGHAGVPDASTTSADPRVDDALSRLAEIDSLPLTEQVEVYADIHRRLAGVLADPDSQA